MAFMGSSSDLPLGRPLPVNSSATPTTMDIDSHPSYQSHVPTTGRLPPNSHPSSYGYLNDFQFLYENLDAPPEEQQPQQPPPQQQQPLSNYSYNPHSRASPLDSYSAALHSSSSLPPATSPMFSSFSPPSHLQHLLLNPQTHPMYLTPNPYHSLPVQHHPPPQQSQHSHVSPVSPSPSPSRISPGGGSLVGDSSPYSPSSSSGVTTPISSVPLQPTSPRPLPDLSSRIQEFILEESHYLSASSPSLNLDDFADFCRRYTDLARECSPSAPSSLSSSSSGSASSAPTPIPSSPYLPTSSESLSLIHRFYDVHARFRATFLSLNVSSLSRDPSPGSSPARGGSVSGSSGSNLSGSGVEDFPFYVTSLSLAQGGEGKSSNKRAPKVLRAGVRVSLDGSILPQLPIVSSSSSPSSNLSSNTGSMMEIGCVDRPRLKISAVTKDHKPLKSSLQLRRTLLETPTGGPAKKKPVGGTKGSGTGTGKGKTSSTSPAKRGSSLQSSQTSTSTSPQPAPASMTPSLPFTDAYQFADLLEETFRKVVISTPTSPSHHSPSSPTRSIGQNSITRYELELPSFTFESSSNKEPICLRFQLVYHRVTRGMQIPTNQPRRGGAVPHGVVEIMLDEWFSPPFVILSNDNQKGDAAMKVSWLDKIGRTEKTVWRDAREVLKARFTLIMRDYGQIPPRPRSPSSSSSSGSRNTTTSSSMMSDDSMEDLDDYEEVTLHDEDLLYLKQKFISNGRIRREDPASGTASSGSLSGSSRHSGSVSGGEQSEEDENSMDADSTSSRNTSAGESAHGMGAQEEADDPELSSSGGDEGGEIVDYKEFTNTKDKKQDPQKLCPLKWLSTVELMLHKVPLCWELYKRNCFPFVSQNEAARRLSACEEGTFFLRPSSHIGHLVISYVRKGIQHIVFPLDEVAKEQALSSFIMRFIDLQMFLTPDGPRIKNELLTELQANPKEKGRMELPGYLIVKGDLHMTVPEHIINSAPASPASPFSMQNSPKPTPSLSSVINPSLPALASVSSPPPSFMDDDIVSVTPTDTKRLSIPSPQVSTPNSSIGGAEEHLVTPPPMVGGGRNGRGSGPSITRLFVRTPESGLETMRLTEPRVIQTYNDLLTVMAAFFGCETQELRDMKVHVSGVEEYVLILRDDDVRDYIHEGAKLVVQLKTSPSSNKRLRYS